MNLFDENNKQSNNMNNIIQGKKINFGDEVSNLNLIQNKNNSNIIKSALKEDNKSSLFFSPTKPLLKVFLFPLMICTRYAHLQIFPILRVLFLKTSC